MNENENNKRIKVSRKMQYIVNVNRLSAIVRMFNDTMSNLDDTWYPKELRPVLNEFRYETLNEFQKKNHHMDGE